MKRTLQLTTLILIIALAAGTALAQGPGRRGGGCFDGPGFGGPHGGFDGPAGRLDGLCQLLDLTEEQTGRIQELRDENRAAMLEMRKDMARLRNEKQGEMLADEPDRGKVLDLVGQMGELRTKMQSRRMEMRWAVRDLLTDEQKDQLAELRLRKGGRGGAGHFGPGGGFGCDGPGHGDRRGGGRSFHGRCRQGGGPRHGR